MFPDIKESPLRPDVTLNYALWSPGTIVEFANVNWGSDYRDIVKFPNQDNLNNYIQRQNGPRVTNMTYARVGEPIDLDVPFTTTQDYNYIRVYNPAQIGNSRARSYYYFIHNSEFIAGNNTRVHVQLDAWQTFGADIRIGNAFIEQGHIGVADQNSFTSYGRDRLTIPEGLDVGGEYVIDSIYTEEIATARTAPGKEPNYSIVVQSTIDFTADLGTFEDPKIVMASGTFSENMPNGTVTYVFKKLADFRVFLTKFKNMPHALQGIVSITAMPDNDRYKVLEAPVNIPGITGMTELIIGGISNKQHKVAENWRDKIGIPYRYRHLKKFKTYPYTVVELTANSGTPLLLKPESWQDEDGTINEIPHFASNGARVMFAPHQYNAKNVKTRVDTYGVLRDGGEFLDMATGIFNFPTFMIANDGAKLYLANNKNMLAYQNKAADWSQTRALSGNQLASDQASASIGASGNATNIGINAAQASNTIQDQNAIMSTGLNAVSSIAGGVGGGPMGIGSGIANAAMGGMRTALDITTRNQQLGVSTGAALAQNANSSGLAGFMRDTNKALADSVANGDYNMAIAGIQAKVQDAMLTQPSTVGQVGGDSFLLSRYYWGYDMIVKLLDPAAMTAVGEYWLRYGYRVSRFARVPESLMVMTHFTYWRLKETYITSSRCPETFKQTIRGIFEKGVTVWNNPDDIGRIDNGDNIPLQGVSL